MNFFLFYGDKLLETFLCLIEAERFLEGLAQHMQASEFDGDKLRLYARKDR